MVSVSSNSPSSTPHSPLDFFDSPPGSNSQSEVGPKTILKSRKVWRTLPDGEPVWPEELEAALFEALEDYCRQDPRASCSITGRFPMRNMFISEWIFNKTGKTRTPKQVGSRLQQLKSASAGRTLPTRILPKPQPSSSPSPRPLVNNSMEEHYPLSHELEYHITLPSISATTSTDPLLRFYPNKTCIEPRDDMLLDTILHIDLLQDSSLENPQLTCSQTEERTWIEHGYEVRRVSKYPRYLRDIDPTITLLSKSMTSAKSYYTVYEYDELVFSESTILESLGLSTSTSDDTYLYRTSLVPGFWAQISKAQDASRYVILQRVIEAPCPSFSAPTAPLFSAIYRFRYASSPSEDQRTTSFSVMTPGHSPSIQKNNFLTDLPFDIPDTNVTASQKSQSHFDFSLFMTSVSDANVSTQTVSHFPGLSQNNEGLFLP